MKAQILGMRPGEPCLLDEEGRRVGLVLRIVPETPEEVAELKRFCRLTEAFTFVIDEEYRLNQTHCTPVYGERSFALVSPHGLEELV